MENVPFIDDCPFEHKKMFQTTSRKGLSIDKPSIDYP